MNTDIDRCSTKERKSDYPWGQGKLSGDGFKIWMMVWQIDWMVKTIPGKDNSIWQSKGA